MKFCIGQSAVSLPAHGRTGRVSPSHYPPIPVKTQFQFISSAQQG